MFELCTVIGCPHPDYLHHYLTSTQLSEWQAFDSLYPIGQKRIDFHVAHILKTITNLTISVHGKKGAKQTNIDDFIPKWGEEKGDGAMTPEQIREAFLSALGKNSNVVFK